MRWSYFCAPSLILHMLEFVIRSVFETMLCFKLNTNNIINKNGELFFAVRRGIFNSVLFKTINVIENKIKENYKKTYNIYIEKSKKR